MRNTALKIAYIGDEFYGLQRQPDNPTIEGELIRVLKKLKIIDKMEIARIRLGGRTDRGVHSLGNVISVFTEWDIHINQINHQLHDDIVIIAKAPVRFAFKPRYAQQRHYRYYFPKNTLNRINLDSINQLPSIFEGTHDFTNFTKKNPKTPVRTIDKIAINTENSFYVDIYGESFLWNMVRKMMRVFLDVGLNNMDL
ncbi:MAG: tRNA pseudouridine(38-40) synthase TruA, partial [Methanobrevibacter sp.]|nr:tRNA pseudouridine(38-40) synthase TruA [Methanobrevibacter sp.]